jgi:carbon-monoxide dehydrogenase large subunit
MGITPGFERVELAMDPSGFLEARIGSSPHGQGLKTSLAQLIADETGVMPDQIRVISGDTDRMSVEPRNPDSLISNDGLYSW